MWQLDDPPKRTVKRLMDTYNTVWSYLVKRHDKYNVQIEADRIDTLIQDICIPLKFNGESVKEAICSICMIYGTDPFTYSSIEHLARAVSGWYDEIKEGKLFERWSPAKGPSWAQIYVEDIIPAINSPKPRFVCTLWSLSGSTVNTIWKRIFPGSFCRSIIREVGGLKYEKYFPEDVGGLYLTATIEQKNDKIQFEFIQASPSQKEYNKKILKARKQICILEKYRMVNRPCFPCEFGRQRCNLARQKRTLIIDVCKNQTPFPHRGAILYKGLCKDCIKRNIDGKLGLHNHQ